MSPADAHLVDCGTDLDQANALLVEALKLDNQAAAVKADCEERAFRLRAEASKLLNRGFESLQYAIKELRADREMRAAVTQGEDTL